MDKETLTACPLIGASGETDFRVKELQFGDGYPQRAPDGIHIDLRTYNLEFKGEIEYIEELDAFFTRHKGVKSFKWTAPDRKDQRLYVCGGHKQRFINSKTRSITVEVKESLI